MITEFGPLAPTGDNEKFDNLLCYGTGAGGSFVKYLNQRLGSARNEHLATAVFGFREAWPRPLAVPHARPALLQIRYLHVLSPEPPTIL